MKLIIIIFIFNTIFYQKKLLAIHTKRLCPLSMSVPLSHGNLQYKNNYIIDNQELLIPYEYQWHDGNFTYGCICNISTTPCIRKCCKKNELLTNSLRPKCIESNETLPDILPNKDNLDDELKNIIGISNHFQIIYNKICPIGQYRLEPENFEEDNYILYSNGSLFATGELLSQWHYCMDWQDNFNNTIVVLICHTSDLNSETIIQTTIYPIGIIISIPFLIATLIVYAIIPELQNLYGKTLMCYVGCLIAAYIFLASERFVYNGHYLCEFIGKNNFYYNIKKNFTLLNVI